MMATRDDRRFIYRIDVENRVSYVNQAWLDFARENQAAELTREYVLGKNVQNFIADWETRHLYDIIYRRVRETGKALEVRFRCDSPFERRLQKLTIRCCGEGGELELEGHILKIEPRSPLTLLQHSGERSGKFLVICSWCKKIRAGEGHWVEIEEAAHLQLFDAIPPDLSHGICPECFAKVRSEIGK